MKEDKLVSGVIGKGC